MPSIAAIFTTLFLGAIAFGALQWYNKCERNRKLRDYYDSVRGLGVMPPVPVHPVLGHLGSWIDQELLKKGMGMPMTKLMEWAKYALDRERFPDGNKFLRVQFMGYWFPLALSQGLMILDVDVSKDMLVAATESKIKKGRSYDIASPIIGQGILKTTLGDHWKHQRKLVEVAFRVENLKYSHKQVAKACMRLLGRWKERHEKAKKEGKTEWFELRNDMLRTTMDVICQVGFGKDYETGIEKEVLMEAEREAFKTESLQLKFTPRGSNGEKEVGEPLYLLFKEILSTMADISSSINPLAYFQDKRKSYAQRIRALDKVVYRMIDQRLERVRKGDIGMDGTLLDAIANIDENGELIMPRKLMADELKTLLFAGHDTTGNGLTWCFYHIASDPEVCRKLRHEVDHVLPEKTSFTDLERATYLNGFIKEVLRVHPSAGFTREVTHPDGITVGGVHLPQGADIWFIPPLMHMQDRYFERASEFIPERWDEANTKLKMDPRAYMPFSLGPRNCVGMKLALLELRCFVVEILRRYNIEYDNSQGAPKTYLGMTLDPGVMRVRVSPRTDEDGKKWGEKIELKEG